MLHACQTKGKARFAGVVAVDVSVFGPARVRGRPGARKRGRETLKQPVFGIFERDGGVYTEIVANCSARTLQDIIRGRVNPESVVHPDGWKGYDGLVDVGNTKPLRIKKSQHFSLHGVHMNRIEAFWSFTKLRLAKLNGVKKNFDLHLKERKCLDNNPPAQLIRELLALIQKKKTFLVKSQPEARLKDHPYDLSEGKP
ncbi:Mobile element protein [Leptospirillum ferriphilum]|jgi:transposase-like protein|uniref:Mobile element protein n=2 Tax=Leptospirillum TaxID=179 RepID=A0A094YMG3_9BACT|nr:MAG: Probable transposase [Leptospirillum sp. Group II '5-way CG']KGA94431.1 Mobile element protein [Leptospirillum ferriphilum]